MSSTKALVTGASSGIGAEYARQLAARGHDLILVARRRDRMETLAAGLRAQGAGVQIVEADLTRAPDLARIAALLREDAAISTLINNAGTSAVGPYSELADARRETLVSLNVVAAETLAHAAFGAFTRAGRGDIVNLSSAVAVGVYPGNVLYSATKAFVLMLTEGMAAEAAAAGSGVRVQAVLPAAVRTEIFDAAGLDLSQLPDDVVMSAPDMVRAALAGLDAGEVITLPSLADATLLERALAAREALFDVLQTATPAPRYGLQAA